MKTEDGHNVYYGVTYFACFFENHSFDIGTDQEQELYKPIKCIFHQGSKPNLFGMKLFRDKSNALKWCDENKK